MMHARIGPADAAEPAVADALTLVPRLDGEPARLFSTLAHHPTLAKRFNLFGGTFITKTKLAADEREAIILRVATRTGSIYELTHHIETVRRLGFDESAIRACALRLPLGPDDPYELVLTMTDELLDNVVVSDATWARLATRYEPAQLVELTLLVGSYRMVAGFLNSAGVQPELAISEDVIKFANALLDACSHQVGPDSPSQTTEPNHG